MALFDLFKQYPVRVRSLTRQGDFCQLRLSYPEELVWEAGAYARFVLPDAKPSRETERALTLATTPEEGEILLIFKDGPYASPYKKALGKIQEGQVLTLRYLYVNTKIQDPEKSQVFFVSDLGIAALRPLLLSLLKEGGSKIAIYHLHRDCLVFDDELSALSHQAQFTYQTLEGEEEAQTALEEAVSHFGDQAVYYLLGVPSHVRSWAKHLKGQGISRKNIKREPFTGLN